MIDEFPNETELREYQFAFETPSTWHCKSIEYCHAAILYCADLFLRITFGRRHLSNLNEYIIMGMDEDCNQT